MSLKVIESDTDTYDFVLVIRSTVSNIKSDFGRKNANFSYPCFNTHVEGVTFRIFDDFWVQ